MRRRLEQLEMDLAESKDENEQLKQRLTTTLNRINILKTTNLRLITECDKLKNDHFIPTTHENRRHDSATSDNSENLDNLQSRLKNTSFDASRQRKLNKTLQTDNETLTKNLQSLTEKYNPSSL
jgi:chromosome segregation ATPase